MSEQVIISLEVPSDLSQWTAQQGKKLGGNRSSFIRGLIIAAKEAADQIPMDDAGAALAYRPPRIVSMKKLREARKAADRHLGRTRGGAK